MSFGKTDYFTNGIRHPNRMKEVSRRDAKGAKKDDRFADFDEVFEKRIAEADEFYDSIATPGLSDDARSV